MTGFAKEIDKVATVRHVPAHDAEPTAIPGPTLFTPPKTSLRMCEPTLTHPEWNDDYGISGNRYFFVQRSAPGRDHPTECARHERSIAFRAVWRSRCSDAWWWSWRQVL